MIRLLFFRGEAVYFPMVPGKQTTTPNSANSPTFKKEKAQRELKINFLENKLK